MKFISLTPANNNIHKWKVVLELNDGTRKTIRFGAAGMSDYTKHRDEERKNRYLERHRENENWNDITTAGAWARWLLWNKPTISESLQDIKQRFGL